MLKIKDLQIGEVLINKWGNKCVVSHIEYIDPEDIYQVDVIWQTGANIKLYDTDLEEQEMKSTGEINQEFITFLDNFKK